MVPAAVAGRAGKTGDGRARTREVKLAALFTQATVDEQGRPVRDPDSTSHPGSFAPAGQFATLVAAKARRRGADNIRQLGVLAALDQRIGLRYTMAPMTDKETGSYLRHHLALAGRDDTIFSDDAVTLVHQTSRGYPRAVNNVALQALVAAFAAHKAIVDESSTRTAASPASTNVRLTTTTARSMSTTGKSRGRGRRRLTSTTNRRGVTMTKSSGKPRRRIARNVRVIND